MQAPAIARGEDIVHASRKSRNTMNKVCLLYTSDAADERSSVDLGGRRIIKKKTIVEKWRES